MAAARLRARAHGAAAAAPMNGLPPVVASAHAQKRDAEHLKLLSIFHFILAGFCFLGIAFVALHYAFMRVFFMNPEIWKNQKGGPPPAEFFKIFIWIYLFAVVVLVAASALNLLSAIFLRQRRHRMFSLVIAGLNCLQFPLGTALGVFTIIVLSRASTHELYETNG
jgi:hypothetical protein